MRIMAASACNILMACLLLQFGMSRSAHYFVQEIALVKSLFIFMTTQYEFVFASEMKALWSASVNKQMDNTMLLNYLALGTTYSRDASGTFYTDIKQLPAAHFMKVRYEPHRQHIN